MVKPLPGLGGQMQPAREVLAVHPDMPGAAGELAKAIENAVAIELVEATERFCKASKLTGVSFVFFGLKHWWGELKELNPEACVDFFHAMADLAEPGADHDALMNAEKRRVAAVQALRTSLQEQMKREGQGP